MKRYVLDANALVGYLGQRPGSARVIALITQAAHSGQRLLVSVVNWGEVIYNVWTLRGETFARDTAVNLSRLPLDVVPVSQEDAFEAARLKAVHKLPYADSFAAALAFRERATLVTSDPHFERLGKQLPVLWLR
jgi:predicted nucleic acid-binding protein